MNKAYNMAVALLQFKIAFSNLAEASKAMPDLDISDAYPFFLLDYEVIAPAVAQWCSIHASRLMAQLPERVDNPSCISCKYYRAGLLPTGLCKGFDEMHCNVHPTIVYSKEAVLPYLITAGVDIKGLDDNSIHLLYIRKAEEIYEKIRSDR